MPGQRRASLARGSADRPAAGGLLPRGLHIGGTDRRDLGPAHLGLGADASSPRAWHRPRRWTVARRRALGGLQAGLLSVGTRTLAAVSTTFPRRTRQGASHRPVEVLR